VSVRFVELGLLLLPMFRLVAERSTELRLLRGVGRRDSFRCAVPFAGLDGVVDREEEDFAGTCSEVVELASFGLGFGFAKCVTVLDLVMVA
jgi:hypothetical protein